MIGNLDGQFNLADYFRPGDVIRDGTFATLGYIDSGIAGTLAYCDRKDYLDKANRNDRISCVLTIRDMVADVAPEKGIVESATPRNAFYRLHNELLSTRNYGFTIERRIGIDCVIHPTAQIAENTWIGNHVEIAENVVIKSGVIIGDHTRIDTGAVIGCEGLLYMNEGNKNTFIRHAGGVSIGFNVNVLSNAVVVKSVHPDILTTIGDNAIIGIGTNIGHEAQIGKNCVLSSHCVIARRADLEDEVWIGPSAVVREHVKIGRAAQVKLGSVVISDVKPDTAVSGNFSLLHNRNLKHYFLKSLSR